MTTALLIIIVLIELARLAIQYMQGKSYRYQTEKTYCTTTEAKNISLFVERKHIQSELDRWGSLGYEIVSVVNSGIDESGDHYYLLLFTRKKIKNHMEK